MATFFIYTIFKPISIILRFFFYKGAVKIYGTYLSFIKRLGWGQTRGNFAQIIFNQKLVHVVVISLTIFLVFINLTTKTKAGGLTDMAHKTILADLVKSEFGEFEEDEQLIIESFDREGAISFVQQSYLDNLGSFRPQLKVNINGEAEEEEVMPTIQGGAVMVKPELAATKKTKRMREEIIEYKVKSGDSPSTIAYEHEISVSTILWENNLSAYSIIKPGDILRILPTSGLSHKVKNGESLISIAKKYKVEEEKIAEVNRLKPDDRIKIGEILTIPGAKKVSYPAYKPKTYTGFTAIKSLVNAPNAKAVVGNKMNWPTVGHYITQYYSWRHHGLDIANKTGTAIYAADAGTVEYVGWGRGYGNQIVIDHGGGKKTRYAHLSKFFVKKGDKVSKGQNIAAMGSTGWSTGPHLHFEVIINGRKYNPLNYIR